jgi:hypothetical protein
MMSEMSSVQKQNIPVANSEKKLVFLLYDGGSFFHRKMDLLPLHQYNLALRNNGASPMGLFSDVFLMIFIFFTFFIGCVLRKYAL